MPNRKNFHKKWRSLRSMSHKRASSPSRENPTNKPAPAIEYSMSYKQFLENLEQPSEKRRFVGSNREQRENFICGHFVEAKETPAQRFIDDFFVALDEKVSRFHRFIIENFKCQHEDHVTCTHYYPYYFYAPPYNFC